MYGEPQIGNEPQVDSSIINHQECDDPTLCKFESINIYSGQTIRLRLINAGTFGVFHFAISGHFFTIIEVDGTDIQPKVASELLINVGQRYSVLVTGNQKPDNYWIQVSQFLQAQWDHHPAKRPYARAILHYVTAPIQNPPIEDLIFLNFIANRTFEIVTQNDFGIDPEDLVPLHSIPPPPATKMIKIDMEFNYQANHSQLPYMNGVKYDHLATTTVLNYLRSGRPFPRNQIVQTIQSGDVVDFVINNLSGDHYQHPMHIHGHKFYVLGRGNLTDGISGLNTVNPIYRDTATVKPSQWMVLRLVADNPGIWFAHCHIDWHLMSGQAFVIVESPDEVLKQYGSTAPVLLYC
jgi:iron transport multicopper oxidase